MSSNSRCIHALVETRAARGRQAGSAFVALEKQPFDNDAAIGRADNAFMTLVVSVLVKGRLSSRD
jgi:hypothetical protein